MDGSARVWVNHGQVHGVFNRCVDPGGAEPLLETMCPTFNQGYAIERMSSIMSGSFHPPVVSDF